MARGKTRFTARFRHCGSFVEGSAGLGRLPGGFGAFRAEITACHGAFSALNALFLPRNVGAGGFGGFRSEIRVSPGTKNALNPSSQPQRGCRPPPPRGKTRFTPRFRRRGSFVEGSAGLGRLPGGFRMFSTEITACHGAFSALNALFLPRNVGAGVFGGLRAEIRVSPCGKTC